MNKSLSKTGGFFDDSDKALLDEVAAFGTELESFVQAG